MYNRHHVGMKEYLIRLGHRSVYWTISSGWHEGTLDMPGTEKCITDIWWHEGILEMLGTQKCLLDNIIWLASRKDLICHGTEKRRTHDLKVAGTSPGRSGGVIFPFRVNFLRWMLFWYPFRPRVAAVARKISLSFYQKCSWQVTSKHTCTLHKWL